MPRLEQIADSQTNLQPIERFGQELISSKDQCTIPGRIAHVRSEYYHREETQARASICETAKKLQSVRMGHS